MDLKVSCSGCGGRLDTSHKLVACPLCNHPLKLDQADDVRSTTPWYAWGPYPLLIALVVPLFMIMPVTILLDELITGPKDCLVIPMVAVYTILVGGLYKYLAGFRVGE